MCPYYDKLIVGGGVDMGDLGWANFFSTNGENPGDNIFFSDIQCKIGFSGWITSHEIYFFSV